MRRGLAWLAGVLGLLALWRWRRRGETAPEPPASDPADDLRARLEQARATEDDRDEFDAAEGQTVDEAGEPLSLDERRRAVHEQARQTLGEMRGTDGE
jgi:hypothetical protein